MVSIDSRPILGCHVEDKEGESRSCLAIVIRINYRHCCDINSIEEMCAAISVEKVNAA